MPDPTILRDPADLHVLGPAWAELWHSDPDATPFQSPDWLLPWWNHFGEGHLRVVVLRRRDTLVGILPCYIYPEPATGIRRLLPIGISTSDYLDGIFAPGLNSAESSPALDLLLNDTGWDELSFPQLRPTSHLAQALTATNIHFADGEATSRIPALPLAELPQKVRRNIMNYRNRAQRLGRLHLVQADEASWPTVFDALCTLHSRRWRQSGQSGVLADPRVVAWHRESLPTMLRSGTARLSSLCLDGHTIAVLYSLLDPPTRAHRIQYCYLIGFSTEYSELSPGTLLLAAIIEQAAAEGIATVDLLRGDEPYKTLWHPERLTPQTAFADRGQ